MGRLEKRVAAKMQKRIMSSKQIPDEKKQEVADAFAKVDLSLILHNPEALADVLANPGHLANYVTETPDENTNTTDEL